MRKFVFLLIIILLPGLLGCGGQNSHSANEVSSIPASAKDTANKVGHLYGENNPKIVNVLQNEEEVTKSPMYIVYITGEFRKGELRASQLSFSMLASGSKVWALTASNGSGTPGIWAENEVNVQK